MNWLTSRSAPVVALVALALTACDTGTALNVDLPDTTSVNTQYQDLPLSVSTVRLAPVQSLKTDHYLVGQLDDNIAGRTRANAYLNVLDASAVTALASTTDSLPSSVTAFTTPAILDSVVMVMGFDQVYGSSTTPARFDVYPLLAPLDERQVYDTNSSEPLGQASDAIGTNLVSRLDRTQQVIVTAAVAATATTAAIPAVTSTASDPTVRLVIRRRAVAAAPGQPAISEVPSLFIDRLFARISQAGFNQTVLNSLLKGIAIMPNSNHTSSIVAFNRGRGQRMLFYYHFDAAGTVARQRFTYSIYFGPTFSTLRLSSSNDPRYYTQIVNNNLPPALQVLNSRSGMVNPAVLNGLSYAQEGTGFATRVSFTGLSDLIAAATAGGLTINRAELRVPVKPYTNALFANPSLLYAVEVDASNNVLQRIVNFIPTDRVVQADGSDQQGVGAYASGTLVDAITNQPYYSLPITSYLQAYLYNKLGGNPDALVLAPNIRASSTLTLNRAALDAANIKLRVYYSKR